MENPTQDYENDKKSMTSDFNEAKFQIYRLHILWLSCNTLSEEGKLIDWKWKLDTIWRELSPDATAKDKGKENNIKATYSYKMKVINHNIAKSRGQNAIYNALQEKEVFLRCLQEEVGKGSKKSFEDNEDFED